MERKVVVVVVVFLAAHLFEQLTGFLKDPEFGWDKDIDIGATYPPPKNPRECPLKEWPKLSDMAPLEREHFFCFREGGGPYGSTYMIVPNNSGKSVGSINEALKCFQIQDLLFFFQLYVYYFILNIAYFELMNGSFV